MNERPSAITGFQASFLILAVVMMHAAAYSALLHAWPVDDDLRKPLGRLLLVTIGGLILASVPPLRRACAELLAPRIPRGRRREVPLAVALNLATVFALVGGASLWTWSIGGEPALARRIGGVTPHAVAMEAAFSTGQLILSVLAAGIIAPIVEELAFRGLLQTAWKPAWGWLGAAIATSIVFQAFHGFGVAQFIAGLIYTAAMRRAGSIRATIYAHSLFNLLLWYPLLGQFLCPSGASTGEIHLWWLHFVCVALVIIALPWYLASSRDSRLDARDLQAQPAA